MNAIEIEVMSQHYTGPLTVEPIGQDNAQFSVYLKNELLGRAQPVQIGEEIHWYSHEITDKELLNEVGEWIAYHYPLTENSFKPIYKFNWVVVAAAASLLPILAFFRLHR